MSEGKTYGQILREKGVGVAPSATPTRSPKVAQGKPHFNGWERGVPTNDRGMPYLDEQGKVIGQKRFAETYRSKFEARDQMRATETLTKE